MEYTGNDSGDGAEIRRDLFGGGFGAKAGGTGGTDEVFKRFQHIVKSLLLVLLVGIERITLRCVDGVDVTLVLSQTTTMASVDL